MQQDDGDLGGNCPIPDSFGPCKVHEPVCSRLLALAICCASAPLFVCIPRTKSPCRGRMAVLEDIRNREQLRDLLQPKTHRGPELSEEPKQLWLPSWSPRLDSRIPSPALSFFNYTSRPIGGTDASQVRLLPRASVLPPGQKLAGGWGRSVPCSPYPSLKGLQPGKVFWSSEQGW